MNKQTRTQRSFLANVLDSVPIYAAVAIILVALLASFYVVLLVNMDTIDSRTEDLKEHPYTVTVAAGRTETLLMQIRTLDDRLAYANTAQTVESVRTEFATVDEQIREELDTVVKRYLGDPQQAVHLSEQYEAFKEKQRELIELGSNGASDAEVANFLAHNIDPRIDEMLSVNADIMEGSSQVFDQLYTTVSTTRSETMATATVLMASVVAVLVLFLVVLARKSFQQRELQQSLRRALENAQDANEAKSRFLSSVSHDIRTPLTAIIGLTDIAFKHTSEQRRVEESLGKIKLSSNHLLNLVNDVLDMSKIESGQADLESGPFSPCKLVQELASIMKPQAEGKDLTFEVVRCDLGQKVVLGDETRTSQILMNLLGNAVKYTEPGGHVRFQALELEDGEASVRSARERCTVRFVIEDDGIGMSEEFTKRMFEPFEREDGPARFKVEGTGLGMSIAKNLIDVMGGTIDVQSKRGVGTTFTVDLPFDVCGDGDDCSIQAASSDEIVTFGQAPNGKGASVSGEKNATKRTSAGLHAEPSWSHVRVLLAEDNELVGEISEEFIASAGASVERAWDGLEVLEMLRRAPEGYYDLIFMDIQMPRMDGLETARAILERASRDGRPHPPIIAMTANAYVEDRERARKAGMDGYVVKPIDAREISKLFSMYVKSDSAGGK